MHQLPTEILLPVFKYLNSKEMVQNMRVCKEWLEVVDENKSLFRRLVLDEEGDLSVLELFDSKSDSQLKEVSMEVKLEKEEVPTFLNLLYKSNETLQILYLSAFHYPNDETFSNLCWKLDNLTDCRIVKGDDELSLKLVEREIQKKKKKMDNSFKVLWTLTASSYEKALSKGPHRFNHLVSVKIGEPINPLRLIAILKQSSETLKTLAIFLDYYDRRVQTSPSLHFPRLEFLDINSWHGFPSWIVIRNSCTIVNRGPQVLPNLPPTSKLWICDFEVVARLEDLCPTLEELRVNTLHLPDEWGERRESFFAMLRQRRQNADQGKEFKGIKMIHLKRLVFPFRLLSTPQLSQMRGLVDEVVDLESVERFIEVEI
jgi:hypothetical protein